MGMIQGQRTHRAVEETDIGIRIAVYPADGEPEITEVASASPRAATVKFTRLVMDKVREQEGKVPEDAVREVVENLIHAGYRGVVISILDGGNVVRVSDKGPGIQHKERALEFGFSGASAEVSREIRGIGAGLGIAVDAARKVGGGVTIEDNLDGGTVVTITAHGSDEQAKEPTSAVKTPTTRRYPDGVPRMNISERQQKVLITVLECGEVGPSTVAETLEISVSTAYRDLSVLEEHGLVMCEESGKRAVTPLGEDLVKAIVGSWVK